MFNFNQISKVWRKSWLFYDFNFDKFIQTDIRMFSLDYSYMFVWVVYKIKATGVMSNHIFYMNDKKNIYVLKQLIVLVHLLVKMYILDSDLVGEFIKYI